MTELEPVLPADQVLDLTQRCREVYVHPVIEGYIVDLVNATRSSPDLALGVSPRGSLALYRTSQALSALRGRHYVIPDDTQALIHPVLAHRLIPSSRRRLRGEASSEILASLVDQVPVPVEEDWAGGAA